MALLDKVWQVVNAARKAVFLRDALTGAGAGRGRGGR